MDAEKQCIRGCRELLESMGKVAETRKGHEAEIPAQVVAGSPLVRLLMSHPPSGALHSLLPLNDCQLSLVSVSRSSQIQRPRKEHVIAASGPYARPKPVKAGRKNVRSFGFYGVFQKSQRIPSTGRFLDAGWSNTRQNKWAVATVLPLHNL